MGKSFSHRIPDAFDEKLVEKKPSLHSDSLPRVHIRYFLPPTCLPLRVRSRKTRRVVSRREIKSKTKGKRKKGREREGGSEKGREKEKGRRKMGLRESEKIKARRAISR